MVSLSEKQKIDEVLTRGVREVIDKDSLTQALSSGKCLRVKLGIDPTSPHLHLGRTVTLRKLRDFQDLGHQAVLIIGDATGVIGDTSDKESERPMLHATAVEENAETYFEQAKKVLDMEKVEIHHNSKWLGKLTYKEIGEHADQFSVADFIARDNIKRRLDQGRRVSLREVLYPLMQGYDSVAVKADVELGGTDQRFNLLAGRALQAHAGQASQNIVMTELIEGTDGRKMSSSWGNIIALTDSPSEMYGRLMSLRDDLVEKYFLTLTRVPLSEIEALAKVHPKEMKQRLAEEIVALYHSRKEAQEAGEEFSDVFKKGGLPAGVPTVSVREGSLLMDAVLEGGVVSSKTEYRRLVKAGAIVNVKTGVAVREPDEPSYEGSFKIGKRRFLTVTFFA